MAEPRTWSSRLLPGLSPRVQARLLPVAETFCFAEGETVFREGEAARYLYILKSGRIAIEIHVPSKGRRPVLTVHPGEVFSWSALVEPYIETASARAAEPSEVLAFKGEVLSALCSEDTALGLELYRTIAKLVSDRLTATRLQMVNIFAVA